MKPGDRLTVDQDCIDKGMMRDICACPISLAFLKAGYVRAYVSSFDAALEDAEGKYYFLNLPSVAQWFIHSFDKSGADNVAPFDFPVLMKEISWCPFGMSEDGVAPIIVIKDDDGIYRGNSAFAVVSGESA